VARQPRNDDEWLARLESEDERTVIAALHAACPCSGSSRRFQDYKDLLARLQKDPRPAVRKTALHLEYDAFEELRKDDASASDRRGGRRRDALRRVGLVG
jgi:hypothetical protein